MAEYTEVRQLGRGGFGVVHEVYGKNGERFAKKTFAPASYIPDSSHDSLRRRFRREVKTQQELGGKEILPVIECDLTGDHPWFVMPMAEQTYEEQIAEDRTNGKVNADAIADILNGLEYLHDMGFVHRDLNPKNILLHEGTWKLSDLGAVLPPQGQSVTLTEGTVIYTEQYCSPEQRNDFHKAQPAADIYSFGCILHDLFGSGLRTPYAVQSVPGKLGVVVEKCTGLNPARRPRVAVLREIVLEALIDEGGHFQVVDKQSEEWLEKLEHVEDWDEEEFESFARFFKDLDLNERSEGFERGYVNSLSTPFFARMPLEPLQKIVQRQDGISALIVEKYCDWCRSTAFSFGFADTVCNRLNTIFDNGTPEDKALAVIALLDLGASHNRWYVMRCVLGRMRQETLSEEEARRCAIEIKTEEVEHLLKRCLRELKWTPSDLATEIGKMG